MQGSADPQSALGPGAAGLSLGALGPELPRIARSAIEAWVLRGERVNAARPGAPRAPVFVTLRRLDGVLRGCIGTTVAIESDVARETVRSALLAASRDPRFAPVAANELDKLLLEVSVLLPEQPVAALSELDPLRWGVVVRGSGGRQGVLLPDVPGVEDVATQVRVARQKAGIASEEPVQIARFAVLKFHG